MGSDLNCDVSSNPHTPFICSYFAWIPFSFADNLNHWFCFASHLFFRTFVEFNSAFLDPGEWSRFKLPHTRTSYRIMTCSSGVPISSINVHRNAHIVEGSPSTRIYSSPNYRSTYIGVETESPVVKCTIRYFLYYPYRSPFLNVCTDIRYMFYIVL